MERSIHAQAKEATSRNGVTLPEMMDAGEGCARKPSAAPAGESLRRKTGRWLRSAMTLAGALLLSTASWAENKPSAVPNMFHPTSTPAQQEFVLSMFVIGMTAGIGIVVGGIWAYVVVKFRVRSEKDSESEPAQVYGSPQVELAWTIIPVILVVVLFLTTARMIFAIQDDPKPKSAIDVTAVGHQFWWEYRYPQYGVVTANELHVPVSSKERPRPTFLKLQSADVWHSFWVPQLAGKVDNIPDHVNYMWIDPQVPGLYVGQCGQFCGTEHAKMLIRVYVDTPDQFQRWITKQQQPGVEDLGDGKTLESVQGATDDAEPKAPSQPTASLQGQRQQGSFQTVGYQKSAPVPYDGTKQSDRTAAGVGVAGNGAASEVAAGKQVFQTNACMNCHAIQGTAANGRFGPNLTHFGGRDTLGSGAAPNTLENLKTWIRNPSDMKDGALMPAMQLNETQLEQVSIYLQSLK